MFLFVFFFSRVLCYTRQSSVVTPSVNTVLRDGIYMLFVCLLLLLCVRVCVCFFLERKCMYLLGWYCDVYTTQVLCSPESHRIEPKSQQTASTTPHHTTQHINTYTTRKTIQREHTQGEPWVNMLRL
jgi:hypothetical protein